MDEVLMSYVVFVALNYSLYEWTHWCHVQQHGDPGPSPLLKKFGKKIDAAHQSVATRQPNQVAKYAREELDAATHATPPKGAIGAPKSHSPKSWLTAIFVMSTPRMRVAHRVCSGSSESSRPSTVIAAWKSNSAKRGSK